METRKRDPKWIELQRLLYCMEENPEPMEGQSWQSLLLRAQLAQDLWHHHVAPKFQFSAPGGCDNSSTYQEYDKLAQRVDQACRHAQEVANQYRQQQKEKHRQRQKEKQRHFGEDDDLVERSDSYHDDDYKVDTIIDDLFFSHEQETGASAEDENGISSSESRGEAEEEEEDEYSDDEQSHEEEAPESHQHHHQAAQPAHSLKSDELQKQQREQMEEAISLMAKQMKDATQGINAKIKQQAQSTLDELEKVAEQNVQDVTAVTQNVQNHNTTRQKSNWGTWTMLFVIIGIFITLLITIFTIPKTSGASSPITPILSKSFAMSKSLLSKAYIQSLDLYGKYFMDDEDNDSWFSDDDVVNNRDNHDEEESEQEEWEKEIYAENEYERKMKEEMKAKMESILNEMRHEKLGGSREHAKIPDWRDALEDDESVENDGDDDDDEEEEEDDNPWGQKPVKTVEEMQEQYVDEDDNPWGQKPVKNVVRDEQEQHDRDDNDNDHDTDDNPWGQEPVQNVVKEEQQQQRHGDNSEEGDTEDDNPWGNESVENVQTEGEEEGVGGRGEGSATDGAGTSSNEDGSADDEESSGTRQAALEDVDEEDIQNRWDSPKNAKVDDYKDYEAHDEGHRDEVLMTEPEEETNGVETETMNGSGDEDSKVQDPSGVDMDTLMASLKQQAEKKDYILEKQHQEHSRKQQEDEQELESAGRRVDEHDGRTGALEREGAAKNRVSPRDLRVAAGSGDIDRLKEHLNLRPEFVNRQDKNGWAPLHLAARAGDISVVELLLEHGAEVHLETNEAEYPYQIAAFFHGRGHPIVKVLRPEGMIDVGDLQYSVQSGQFRKVQEYMQLRPDFANHQDENGWTPLHEAVRLGYMPVIRMLVIYGADKTVVTNGGETAFHLADAQHGRAHEVTKLVRPDGYLDDTDIRHAAFDGDLEKITKYAGLRPDLINIQDNAGWSAIHEAARNGNVAALKILIDAGGDKEQLTVGGKTAYQIALNTHGVDHEALSLLRPGRMSDNDEVQLLRDQRRFEHEQKIKARREERRAKRQEAARIRAQDMNAKQRAEKQVCDRN